MPLVRDQSLVLADTSFFCRFAQSMLASEPLKYLGSSLATTIEVVAELDRHVRSGEHPGLKGLGDRDPPWYDAEPVVLSDAELQTANALAEGWRRLAERRTGVALHHRADLGEASTIVAAQARGCAVILDEGKAKKHAQAKGLTVFTTQDVVIEMVAVDRLKPRPAFLVYQHVYAGSTLQDFESAVEVLRSRIGRGDVGASRP